MPKYRFIWRDRTTSDGDGSTPEAALNALGYGAGAVGALDYYTELKVDEQGTIEEVLFSSYDSGWECNLPVTLIMWNDGGIDVHSQTGSNWGDRMKRADEILRARKLKLQSHNPVMIGPSGGYVPVLPLETP